MQLESASPTRQPNDQSAIVIARLRPMQGRGLNEAVHVDRVLPATVITPHGQSTFHGAYDTASNERIFRRVGAPLVEAVLAGVPAP